MATTACWGNYQILNIVSLIAVSFDHLKIDLKDQTPRIKSNLHLLSSHPFLISMWRISFNTLKIVALSVTLSSLM